MGLEGIALSAAGMAASELANNKDVHSWIGKLAHRIYKYLFLKPVKCFVAESHVVSELQINVNDDKYVVINLEQIYKTMLSEEELEAYNNLKIENMDVFTMRYYVDLKRILNAMRNQYRRDKTVVVLLSSVQLANAMHIDSDLIQVYQMRDEAFAEVMKNHMTDKANRFALLQRNKHLPLAKMLYADVKQLEDHIGQLCR